MKYFSVFIVLAGLVAMPLMAATDGVAVNDIYHLSKEASEPSYRFDVLANDSEDQPLTLISALCLDAQVDISEQQVVLTTPSDPMSQLSISYVVQDAQGNYYTAQAVVVFDLP